MNTGNTKDTSNIKGISQTLRWFFGINYILVCVLVADNVPFIETWHGNKWVWLFLIGSFLMYSAFYLLPAIAVTKIAKFAILKPLSNRKKQLIIYAIAIFTAALTSLLLYANGKLFSLYGMYINGFVLNLVFTPGGIESLGGSQQSDLGFAAIALGFVLLQLVFMWLAKRVAGNRHAKLLAALVNWRLNKTTVLVSLTAIIGLHMTFAYDRFTSNGLSVVAESIPFYQTISSRGFFRSLGVSQRKDSVLKMKGVLNYPLHKLQIKPPTKPYNIVWLVSESWRADTLNPEVMPNTWMFAKTASRFTQNYSSGNGTRAGVFGMLMGLPASYWFQFLQEQKGAAILDVMRQQQYQMRFYTSALFTYPEFDRTVFAQVPVDQMQALQYSGKLGWQNDQQNVTDLLQFIDKRDNSKPFFTFMFFESPHARYFFPPESVIAKPYRDDLNYATLGKLALRNDILPIKNRYINAVHHLDSQLARVFSYLKDHQLLENTIVVLVGDHGEEFMEHGFWGHNSTFVDEQVRTPLVIYIPQQAGKVTDRLTSHNDIVPTLMPMLGVTNPSSDYSIGLSLLGNEVRDHAYIADWDRLAYVDNEVKIVQPVNSKAFFMQKISTKQDAPLVGAAAKTMLEKKRNSNVQIKRDLSHFTK